MKRLFLMVGRILCICVLPFASSVAEEAGHEMPSGQQNIPVLFVQQADSAALQDGKLVLTNPKDTLTWFADRPYRTTGDISITDFIEGWGLSADSFQENPPNVVVIASNSEPLVLELTDPAMTGTRLQYNAIPLKGSADVQLLIDVTLVIDSGDWCWTCNPGGGALQ